MKRKHIFMVTIIVLVIYVPFVLELFHLMILQLDSSNYIMQEAYIKEIKMSYSKNYIISIEYQLRGNIYVEEKSYKIGDCVGDKIPIAIHKDKGNVYRNEIVLNYNDFSVFFAGACLLMIENYVYTNKKKRYKRRKEQEEYLSNYEK